MCALCLLCPACGQPDSAPVSTLDSLVPNPLFESLAEPLKQLEQAGAPPRAPPFDSPCPQALSARVFTSPAEPSERAPLRIAVTHRAPLAASLFVYGPDQKPLAADILQQNHQNGHPSAWIAEIPSPQAGQYKIILSKSNRIEACTAVDVKAELASPARPAWGPFWPTTSEWNAITEDLYSAWIEHLFDAPLGEQISFPALHHVLRDPKRNFLHNHLGLGEDDEGPKAIAIEPDCADFPYYLRAYFSFKLGLPFGFSSCTRGAGGLPPRCVRWHSHREAKPTSPRGHASAFGEFLRVTLADAVHSGAGRIPGGDDRSDYYSIALSAENLRPGAIYADPYGHVLIVVKRIPQGENTGGILLAVDGQPDGTVARRRYWRGNFLFALEAALGGPGFKRFRPIVREGQKVRPLSNDEIKNSPDYGDFGLDQYEHGIEGFYDRMDEILSPQPRSAEQAMLETFAALEEQVRGRVLSVKNGQAFIQKNPEVIEMPEGPSIFETVGPWEDFSTPSRDLRLLIAIDIVRGFTERVLNKPERYVLPEGKSPAELKATLDALLAQKLSESRIEYEKSDGTPFSLSIGDVMARAEALEMAYNPNDCIEIRWGAPKDSDERKSCKRRAPADQHADMRKYRAWFHERRRPPRM